LCLVLCCAGTTSVCSFDIQDLRYTHTSITYTRHISQHSYNYVTLHSWRSDPNMDFIAVYHEPGMQIGGEQDFFPSFFQFFLRQIYKKSRKATKKWKKEKKEKKKDGLSWEIFVVAEHFWLFFMFCLLFLFFSSLNTSLSLSRNHFWPRPPYFLMVSSLHARAF
jgi:hypothetical protein